MSLFVHWYGNQFSLNNCQTLRIRANPELAHSINHSFIQTFTVVGNQRQWPFDQSISDHRHDNSLSYPVLELQRHQLHWISIARGTGVGREVATISMRQTTPNQHTVSVKTANLLRKHSIQLHCLSVPPHFHWFFSPKLPLTEILEPPPPFPLTHHYSSYVPPS